MYLFINWSPDAIAFHIGPVAVQWYGLFWGSGLMATFFIGQYILRTINKAEDKLTILIQYIFVFGIIGARLMQVFYYEPAYYFAHPLKIPAVWEGGLASHGGIIGGIIGLIIFCYRNPDYPILWTMDHAAIAGLTLAGLIRIGNLFNSELYGTPTTQPWGFIFTHVDNIPRHPVVLYEAIAYFIIQLIQLYLFNKYKDSKPGLYLVVFFIGVFGVRFMLEFLKVPEGDLIFNAISSTQLLNIPFILSGFVFLYLMLNKKLSYNITE